MGPLRNRRAIAELLLILVALAWGAGFPVMKAAISELPVLATLWLRFSLSTLLIAPGAYRSLSRMESRGATRGIVLGTVLFLSFLFLILGLSRTTASNAGFLAGLGAVWVPLLAGPLLRKPAGVDALIALVPTLIGLFLLNYGGAMRLGSGDFLVLLGSLFTALHILGLDAWTEGQEPWALTFIQLATLAVLSFFASLVLDPITWPRSFNAPLFGALVFTGAFSTAFAFWAQTSFQRQTTPTRAMLIYLLEPVFSAIFAVLLLGETLTTPQGLGGLLMLLGILTTQVLPNFRRIQSNDGASTAKS